MIKINLLSPLDKENLKWEKINNMAIKSIIWVMLAQAVFVGVFLFSVEYLKVEKGVVASQFSDLNGLPATKEVNAIERDLKINRGKIANIYSIQNGHIKWTSLFESVSNLVPAGVRLENVNAQEDSPVNAKAVAPSADDEASDTAVAAVTTAAKDKKIKVEISGNAKTRELLLALEAKLKGSDMFFDLQYDTANYVESADIDFKYTFYVYEEKLIK